MKTLTTMLLIFCLTFLMIGCDKQKSLEKAEKTSKQLAGYANEGVNITRQLYREKLITANQTLEIANMFGYLANGGIAFDKKVGELKKFYADNKEKPNKKTLDRLAQYFRSNVVIRFIEVLEALKIIQPSEKFKNLITAIKTAVLIVADALDIGEATKVDLAGV